MFLLSSMFHHSPTIQRDNVENNKEYMLEKYFFRMTEVHKDKISGWNKLQEPKNDAQDFFLFELKKAIDDFNKSFRIQHMEASAKEGKLYYREGEKVAIGYKLFQWNTMAKQFLPEYNSRVTTMGHLFLFYALRCVEVFWTIEDLCDNSYRFGNFWDAHKSKHTFEVAGQRKAAGFCDGIGNTSKICMYNEKIYAVCGGHCGRNGEDAVAGYIDFSKDTNKLYNYASVVVECD